MLKTLEIEPAELLRPLIRCYRHRFLDTNQADLVIPWYPSNDLSLTFHFQDVPKGVRDPQQGNTRHGGNYGGLLGIGTRYSGEFILHGRYAIFEVLFKPTGFQKIFGINASELNDHLVYVDDVIHNFQIPSLFEQLSDAGNPVEINRVADNFLIHKFTKSKYYLNMSLVTYASNQILKSNGNIDIGRLAYEANATIRTLERSFVKQVGVSPKFFASLTRFNHALKLKTGQPSKTWTEVANEANYYDQMHLVRDFKRFGGNTPTAVTGLLPKEV